MSLEEVGAYSLLLSYDWNEGGLPGDLMPFSRWLRSTPRKAQALWDAVKANFELRPDGRWYNPRLEKERAKQLAWSEKSARGGHASAERRAKGGARVVDESLQPNGNTPFASPIAVTTSTGESKEALPESPRPSKRKGAMVPTENELRVGAFYRATHPKRGPLDDEDYWLIRKRLVDFSPVQLEHAIKGNREDEWHRQRRKHELSYVLRTNGKVSEFIDRHDALNAPLVKNGKMTEEGLLYFGGQQ